MNVARFSSYVLISAAILGFPDAQAQSRSGNTASAADAAFQKFWAADSPIEAAKVAEEIAKTGISFDDALRRLQAGRALCGAEKTGVIQLSNRTSDGIEHFYSVNVPARIRSSAAVSRSVSNCTAEWAGARTTSLAARAKSVR